MSTVLEQVSDLLHPADAAAREAYRQSVRDGRCDESINDAAGKAPHDWSNDRRRWQGWQKAAATLAAMPQRQAAADAAEDEAAAAATIRETTTFGELAAKLHASNPKLPLSTPGDWAIAMHQLACQAEALHMKAASARTAASLVAIEAEQTLHQLSRRGAGGDGAVNRIGEQIRAVQARLAKRHGEVFNIDARVREQRSVVNSISEGRIPPDPSDPAETFERSQTRRRKLYFAAKDQLAKLLTFAASGPGADVANEKDKAELKRLRGEAAKAHQAALVKLADEQNFKWGDDE